MIRSGYKKNFRHSFTFGFILSLVSSLGYWEHRISTNSCLALISITWSTSSAKLKPFQWQILYVLTSPLVTEPRKELNRLQEWTNSKSWRSWNRSVKLTSSVQKWNSNRYCLMPDDLIRSLATQSHSILPSSRMLVWWKISSSLKNAFFFKNSFSNTGQTSYSICTNKQ